MRLLHLVVAAALAGGCTCNKSSALNEKPPDDLPARGLVIDQPAEGATLTGAWTTVAGWVDPDAVQGVLAVGAPVEGFYLPAGHVGAPTVPVTIRKDGRFYAPRVPLQDGEVKLTLIPVGKGGSTYQAVTRTVNASNTAVAPATLVVEPVTPQPGQEVTLRATTGEDLSTSFQWDFEGDGTFDAEGASVKHTWPAAGRFLVVARTKVKDEWVSAVSLVVVDAAAKVLASAPVDHPTRIFFLSVDSYAQDETVTVGANTVPRDLVAVVDGDLVRVFNPDLTPRFTLSGLSQPSGVARTRRGGLLVADTGHDRLVAFTATGELDTAFAVGGEYKALRRPVSVTFDGKEVLLDDGTPHHRCHSGKYRCENCPAYDCEPNTHLLKAINSLGAERIDRFVLNARADKDHEQELFLAQGRLLHVGGASADERSAARPVVDAVAGPVTFNDHYATIDERGRIHIYRWPWHEGPFTLPYAATAIATDRTGRLYVAGPGVIELRDFQPLK